LHCALPITMVPAYRNARGAVVTPGVGSSSLCSIKTNFVNLIHQADLQVNGKLLNLLNHSLMLLDTSNYSVKYL